MTPAIDSLYVRACTATVIPRYWLHRHSPAVRRAVVALDSARLRLRRSRHSGRG